MIELQKLSLTELLLVRNWVKDLSVSSLKINYIRQLYDLTADVDKELWNRLLSNETPWDQAKRYTSVKRVNKVSKRKE